MLGTWTIQAVLNWIIVQVANSYGNAPHGIGYNSYGGAYHAPYQPNLYNQQYYMPQGYNGSSYGTPQGYQGNPGLSNYGNSGYSTGHALGGAAPPPHGKFPNYANQGKSSFPAADI